MDELVELNVSARTARWLAAVSAEHAAMELGSTAPEAQPHYASQLAEIASAFAPHRATDVDVTVELSKAAVGALGAFYDTYADRTGRHELFRAASALLRAALYLGVPRLPDEASPSDLSI